MIPTVVQLAAEQAAAAWAVSTQPLEWDGVKKKSNQELEYWLANVAYWRMYPFAPKQLPADPKDVWVTTYMRIHGMVLAELEKLQPAPSWTASSPRWPLSTPPRAWKPGSKFGVKRPWSAAQPTRNHCGIDLSSSLGAAVLAPEPATVVAVDQGWEAPAKAVVLHLDSGHTAILGGTALGSSPPKGTRVAAGALVGRIGAYPGGSTMCHFQLYRRHLTLSELNQQKSWRIEDPPPPDLLDPHDYLTAAKNGTPLSEANAGAAFFGVQPDEPAAEDFESAEQFEGDGPPLADASGGTGAGAGVGAGSGAAGSGTGGLVPAMPTSSVVPIVALGGLVVVVGAAFVFTRNRGASHARVSPY